MHRYLIFIVMAFTGFGTFALAQFSDELLSIDLAPNPSNGNCLTTDGTDNVWGSCGSGVGGGGVGWATTTGNIILYSTEGTGALVVSPNDRTSTGTMAYMNVYGGLSADWFLATSTASSSLFAGGIRATASSTISSLTVTTGTTTNGTSTTFRTTTLGVGSDYLTDITGTGLSITNGVLNASFATGTTLVCASGCPYSDIQTALDAGVRNIQLKEETYAGPVRIKFSDTKITGAGATSTIITCDAAVNSPCVAMATTTRLTRMILRDFTIDNTNATFLGTGLDTSDTSKVYASNIRSQEFNIAHLHQDTTNSSFYSRFENMDYYASSSCFRTAGTKSNMNTIDTARCIVTASAGIGYGFYDAEGWLLNSIDSEPGLLIGTGVYIDATSIAITMVNPWMEGNATGTEIRAGALNTSIKGGRITAGTIGVYDGGTNTFLDSTLVSANTTNHTCPSTCLGSYINTSSTFGTPHMLVGTTSQNSSFNRLGLTISTSDSSARMAVFNNAGAFATAPAGFAFTHSSGGFTTNTGSMIVNPGSGYTNATMEWWLSDSSKTERQRLTLDVNGRFGIGSTSPGHLLTVQGGNAYFGGDTIATGTATSTNVVATSILRAPYGSAPSVVTNGDVGIDSTSNQLKYQSNGTTHALTATITPSIVLASTTKNAQGRSFNTATTTFLIKNYSEPMTMTSFYCRASSTGSVSVRFSDASGNGTNSASCTTTGTLFPVTTNNTWTAYEDMNIEVGTSATNPSIITVSPNLFKTPQ